MPPNLRYRLLLTAEIFDFGQALRSTERRTLREFFRFLADHPFCEGDYNEPDEEGRPVEILLKGGFLFAFWADHAVKEVRVVWVDRA